MPEPAGPDRLAKLHAESRIPPADLVGKVDKGFGKLDYMGHAAVTDVLLAHDPEWSWEPFALDEHGLPLIVRDSAGHPRALWIRLTVHGHTRPGIGTCAANAGDPFKELIGDAIRNAAMRFGIGLSLWAKEEWQDLGVEAGGTESGAVGRSLTATTGSSTDPANRRHPDDAQTENAPRPRTGRTGRVSQFPTPSDSDVARHPAAAAGRRKTEPVLPKDQALAKMALELGLDDQTRQDVIQAITARRDPPPAQPIRSGKDLEPHEVIWVATAYEELASGVVELRYEPDGTPRLGKPRPLVGNNPGPSDEPF